MPQITLLAVFGIIVACSATISAFDLETSSLSLGDLACQEIHEGLT